MIKTRSDKNIEAEAELQENVRGDSFPRLQDSEATEGV